MPERGARKPNEADLAAKVRRYQREQELGQKHYAAADAILAQLALELDCGVLYRISPKRFVSVADKEKDGKILHVGYARRYELKVSGGK